MEGKRTLALVLLVGCLIFFLQQGWAMSMDQAREDGELFATGKRDEVDSTMPTEETRLSSENIPQYSQQAVDEGKEGELYNNPDSITDEALAELSTDENGQYLVNSANTRPKWEIYRDDPIITGTTEIMEDRQGACTYEFVCDEGTEEGDCHRLYELDSTPTCITTRIYGERNCTVAVPVQIEIGRNDVDRVKVILLQGDCGNNNTFTLCAYAYGLCGCGTAEGKGGTDVCPSDDPDNFVCPNQPVCKQVSPTDTFTFLTTLYPHWEGRCRKEDIYYRLIVDEPDCITSGDPSCQGAITLELDARGYYEGTGTATGSYTPRMCVWTGEDDESNCQAYINDDACTIASRECNEDTCKDLDCGTLCGCFSYLDTYACYRITEDTCGKGPEEGVCTQTAYGCIEENDDWCTKYRVSYHCDARCNKGHWEVVSCDTDVYCAGEFCFPQEESPADSEGFAKAATYTEVIKKTALEDPKTPKIFEGKSYKCKKILGGVAANCCNFSGILEGWLIGCSEEEHELAEKHKEGKCHYVGSWCCAKALFVCLAKCKRYCCFHSKLARIIHEQGRGQLGDDFAEGCHLIPDEENPGYFMSSKECWGSPEDPICQGFKPEDLERINFEQIDFSEYYSDIVYELSLIHI